MKAGSHLSWRGQPHCAFCPTGKHGAQRIGAAECFPRGQASDSPEANSRMVQGISPPMEGWEISLRPQGYGAPCQPETTVEKGEASVGLYCFLSGRKLHTGLGTKRDSLLSPPLPQTHSQPPYQRSAAPLSTVLYIAREKRFASSNPKNLGSVSGLRGKPLSDTKVAKQNEVVECP